MNFTTDKNLFSDLPSFSQFYTSEIGTPDDRGSSYFEELQEAIEIGSLSWPAGSRYEILDAIAVGGMGAILQASERISKRKVAMKVMIRADTESPAAKRFMREAIIVSSLEHPNIVPVHDIGISPLGDPYFTMKLVQGENLADVLYKVRSRDPEYFHNYDLPTLLEILIKVCNGVAFAHSRSVVHLDLKPHNILVGDYGEVLVLDWGLARVIPTISEDNPLYAVCGEENFAPTTSYAMNYNYSLFTEDGTIKGTPGFMAPEQAHGNINEIDQRADVFSLGTLLYMMLTLRVPIIGENSSEILQHTIKGNFVPPGKRLYQHSVPEQLEAIVMKAMTVDVEERYTSVKDFQKDISAYLSGHVISVEKDNVSKKIYLFLKRKETEVSLFVASAVVTICLVSIFMFKLKFKVLEASSGEKTSEVARAARFLGNQQISEIREKEKTRKMEAEGASLQADFNDYVANIRLAELNIQKSRFDVASGILENCSKQFRHWEWGHLKYLTEITRHTIQIGKVPTAADLSSDGSILAATAGSVIVIIDVETGKITKSLYHKQSIVTLVTLNRDGKKLLSDGFGNSVGVWDVDSGSVVRLLSEHPSRVSALAMDPTNKKNLAVTGSLDGTVIFWDYISGKKLRTVKEHHGSITSISISSDGRRVVTGGNDGALRLWDGETGSILFTIDAHNAPVTSVILKDKRQTIVSGSRNNMIKFWNSETGKQLHVIRRHPGNLNSLDVTDNLDYLVTSGTDSLLRFWDGNTGALKYSLAGHLGPIGAISVEGGTVATASLDSTIKTWSIEKVTAIRKFKAHPRGLSAVSQSPNGKWIATGGEDGKVKVWSEKNGKQTVTFTGHTGPITTVSFTSDGEYVISGSRDRTLRLWKLKSASERSILPGHTGAISALAVSKNTRKIISGSYDKSAIIWDSTSGRQLVTLQGHKGIVTGVAISSDGKTAITAGDSQTITIWDAETGQKTHHIGQLGASITAITISSNDQFVAVGDTSGRITIVDIVEGEPNRFFIAHQERINTLTFSDDSRRVVSGGNDMAVRVWDVESGMELATFYVQYSAISSVSINKESRRIICGNSKGQVNIWAAADWAQ